MPPVLVSPDAFKGTFRATQVAAAIGRGLERAGCAPPDLCPVADGGEGTAEVLLTSLGGEVRGARATDPLGREIATGFALLDDGGTAIVEVAEASGLHRVCEADRDPEAASSRGTGELVAAAVEAGAEVVLVAAGGSATTDGGAGAIAAIEEAGGLRGATLVVLCDVRIPFEEAPARFGPQKGAGPEAVTRLERRLDDLAERLPRDPRGVPHTGAAGGLAGGLWAAFGARLVAGAPFVLDELGLDARMRAASAVIVGEGRLDDTTLHGKIAGEAATRARQAGVPCHAVVGQDALDLLGRRILDLQWVIEAGTWRSSRRPGSVWPAPCRTLLDVADRRTIPRPMPASLTLPTARRAVVVGAGLLRHGRRRPARARRLAHRRCRPAPPSRPSACAPRGRTRSTCPASSCRRELRIETVDAGVARAEFVFLGVPSARPRRRDRVASPSAASAARTAVVSLAKGLVPPDGVGADPPAAGPVRQLAGRVHRRPRPRARDGARGRRPRRRLLQRGAGQRPRAGLPARRRRLRGAPTTRSASSSPARRRTPRRWRPARPRSQGLNAAGAAAGHIFAEVWRFAESQGARPESLIGLAGTGDLVATALAPQSRNRRAGELLAEGVPTAEIPARIGQAVEALESVPLLARALERAGVEAPVTSGLAQLIAGDLPLDDWVALVRTTVPPSPARWRGGKRRGPRERLLDAQALPGSEGGAGVR